MVDLGQQTLHLSVYMQIDGRALHFQTLTKNQILSFSNRIAFAVSAVSVHFACDNDMHLHGRYTCQNIAKDIDIWSDHQHIPVLSLSEYGTSHLHLERFFRVSKYNAIRKSRATVVFFVADNYCNHQIFDTRFKTTHFARSARGINSILNLKRSIHQDPLPTTIHTGPF